MKSGLHSVQGDQIIFYVDTVGFGRKYMSIESPEYADASESIVFVSAERLLTLWQNNPTKQESHLAFGGKSEWVADSKYALAEEGFSSGICSPVPLASIECRKLDNGRVYVHFSNGITRTIWLLAQGASFFPVETSSSDSAILLNEMAGTGQNVMTACNYKSLLKSKAVFCWTRADLYEDVDFELADGNS